jgi:hypothetical protein
MSEEHNLTDEEETRSATYLDDIWSPPSIIDITPSGEIKYFIVKTP